MAKLLIIEDHIRMVKMIQKGIFKLNEQFTPRNTFCFAYSDEGFLGLHALESIPPEDNTHVVLEGKQDNVFSEVFKFLDENHEENVLILIDVLLNSQNTNAPFFERYRADNEYSCELYAELLRIKNGKIILGCENINRKNFFHIIYSRSDSSIGVVAAALNDLWESQTEEDQKYFPKECALVANISWCRSKFDATNSDLEVSEVQTSDRVLALPREYRKFISRLK